MAKLIRRPPCGPKVVVGDPIPDGLAIGQVPVWDGNAYVPGIPIGIPQSAMGIDWSAPVIFTLVPPNHPAGIYAVKLDIINRVPPSSGNFNRVITYSAPLFGPTADVRNGVNAVTGPGHLNANALAVISLSSDGVDPIILTLTPVFISGSSIVVDIYAAIF